MDRDLWRPARWVVPLFALAALGLVPWVVFLVKVLPSDHRSRHWDVAWGGFDVALALLLVGVAFAAWRRSPWLEEAATATATLLVVDAWFDVLTSATRTELIGAVAQALLLELPLAFLSLRLARNAGRRTAREHTDSSPGPPEPIHTAWDGRSSRSAEGSAR